MMKYINIAIYAISLPMFAESRVSGTTWSHCFRDSPDVDTLESPFREKVKKLIAALKNGGSNIQISARRSKETQYLMHWAWKISNEGYTKNRDPRPQAMEGVEIDWFWENPKSTDSCGFADLHDVPNYVGAAMTMNEDFMTIKKPQLSCKLVEGKAVNIDACPNLELQRGDRIVNAVDANGKTWALKLNRPDYDKNLQKFAATFGVYYVYEANAKWGSHYGYWSDDGKWE